MIFEIVTIREENPRKKTKMSFLIFVTIRVGLIHRISGQMEVMGVWEMGIDQGRYLFGGFR